MLGILESIGIGAAFGTFGRIEEAVGRVEDRLAPALPLKTCMRFSRTWLFDILQAEHAAVSG